MHDLIVQLSQFYARLRPDSQQQLPASSSGKTVKYMVPAEHVTALKLFAIKHLAILEPTSPDQPGPDYHAQQKVRVSDRIWIERALLCICQNFPFNRLASHFSSFQT